MQVSQSQPTATDLQAQWTALHMAGLPSDTLSRTTAVTVTSKQQILGNYLSGPYV